MGLKKYRADKAESQADGATLWFADWFGGPSLAQIENCRLASLVGDMRTTVYIQGEPDTWFSQPAKFRFMDKVLNGYVTGDGEGNLVCRHCYY